MKNLHYLAFFFLGIAELNAPGSTAQTQTTDPLQQIMAIGISVGFDGTKPKHSLIRAGDVIKFTKDGVEYAIKKEAAKSIMSLMATRTSSYKPIKSTDQTKRIILEINESSLIDTDGYYIKNFEELSKNIKYKGSHPTPDSGAYILSRKDPQKNQDHQFKIGEVQAAMLENLEQEGGIGKTVEISENTASPAWKIVFTFTDTTPGKAGGKKIVENNVLQKKIKK